MVSFTQIALAAPLLLGVVSAAPLPAQDQNLAVRAEAAAIEARDFAIEERNNKEESKKEVKKEGEHKHKSKSHAKSGDKDDLSNEPKDVLVSKAKKLMQISQAKGAADKELELARKAAKKATGDDKKKAEDEVKKAETAAKAADAKYKKAIGKAKSTFKALKAKHAKGKKHGKHSKGKKHGKHAKGKKEEKKEEDKKEEVAERDIDDSELELMMLARDLDYYHDIDPRDINEEYEVEVRDFDFDDEYYM